MHVMHAIVSPHLHCAAHTTQVLAGVQDRHGPGGRRRPPATPSGRHPQPPTGAQRPDHSQFVNDFIVTAKLIDPALMSRGGMFRM